MTDDHYALDEIDRVLSTARLQSPHGRPQRDNPTGTRQAPGGEYDSYFQLSTSRRKRLAGADYIQSYPRGTVPDELADLIINNLPLSSSATTCDALDWYFRTAERAIQETREQAQARRFQARNKRAREEGQDSYYYQRLFRNAMQDSDAPPAGHHPDRKASTHTRQGRQT